MFEILAHANLLHQLILISVHASQLTNVSKNILNTICKLKHKIKKYIYTVYHSKIDKKISRKGEKGEA